jgi:hypothetical protein
MSSLMRPDSPRSRVVPTHLTILLLQKGEDSTPSSAASYENFEFRPVSSMAEHPLALTVSAEGALVTATAEA